MEDIELIKNPKLQILFFQFGDILSLEAGLLIYYFFLDFQFYIFQSAVIPIFLYLTFTKYTKSVTNIRIDGKNRMIYIKLCYFLIYSKCFYIPFNEIKIKIRNKWLLRYYYEVFEFKKNNKTIAVIPYKISIWDEDELDKLKVVFRELERENQEIIMS
jgi:hypothetical protein